MAVKLTDEQAEELLALPILEVTREISELRIMQTTSSEVSNMAWRSWRNASDEVERLNVKIEFLKKRLQEEL